ncbi:MAG TPA: hypothetical protein DCM02_01880 [Flavobacterium sp.]|nr:hypothetical protein [Flavobacterium sp.]
MKQYRNKSKFKIAFLLLTVFGLNVSCEDILEQEPISEIGPNKFWKNNSDALAGIIGMYDGMQATYRFNYHLWGEFRSDNFKAGSSGATLDRLELVRQNITEGNSTLRWDNLYVLINRANQAIKYIPTITAYDKSLLAEAHAVRAFSYFKAINVWGSVPLYTLPTESVTDIQRPRTPGATILTDVIIPDMLKAEELMITNSSNFRFSKASIYCLQAEVYMWIKDYPKAKAAIEKLIALNAYSLVTTVQAWEDLFYNTPISTTNPSFRGKIQTGPELIFSIRFDIAESATGAFAYNRSGVSSMFYTGIPAFYLSSSLQSKWIERFPTDQAAWEAKYPGVPPAGVSSTGTLVYGDWRYFLSRDGGYANTSGNVQCAKYNKTAINGAFDDTDIVIYRYADMILLLAEAENQLNADGAAALARINQIRTARKLPLATLDEFGATKEERENYILDERQFELLGEGKRWWDLRRTNKALEVLNPILETAGLPLLTEDRLLFPIHFVHLVENPNLLPQNAGY